MKQSVRLAVEATRRLRSSPGWAAMSLNDRSALHRDLARIETALTGDPYSTGLASDANGGGSTSADANKPAPPPAPPPTPPSTSQIGGRAADALAAVNFSGFVAGLVTGTFQAIVDATAQQLKEYASLVASISQSVDSFSRDNVSPGQVRGWLAERYPTDLQVQLPAGKTGDPKLVPRPESAGQSPAWLEQFGLQGQELSEELTEGALVDAGRLRVGEERLQTLASMVLMGINRIVVNDGDIRAKLQFHAVARDLTNAEMAAGQMGQGIAGRQLSGQGAVTTMVSTLKANAQADASIKTNLMGEVRISFRSETFPLERFADSPAIQLLNRHARWTPEATKTTTAPVAAEKPGGSE